MTRPSHFRQLLNWKIFCILGSLMAFTIDIALAVNDPENQILIIEDFISPKESKALMQFYDQQKIELQKTSDNQLSFSPSTDPQIVNIVSSINEKVLNLMQQAYSFPEKNTM